MADKEYLDSDGVKHLVKNIYKKIGDAGKIAQVDKGNHITFAPCWLYYTTDLNINKDPESSAIAFSKMGFAVIQLTHLDKTADGASSLSDTSKQILARAKELNPKFRLFSYIQSESERSDFKTSSGENSYLNSDGSWEGSTADQAGSTRIYSRSQLIEFYKLYKSMGFDGIFFDDWGYDNTAEHICWQMGYDTATYTTKNDALNKKWSDLIDDCHEYGLAVITNGGTPMSVGDWYTHLNEDDIICLESNFVSSNGPGQWNNGADWAYNYYKDYYLTGKCKALTWSLDYFPNSISKSLSQEIITYCTFMALACGCGYVSVGVANPIEFPPIIEMVTRGSTRNITYVSKYTMQYSNSRHTFEVSRPSSVTGQIISDKNIKNYYIQFDGTNIQNMYRLPNQIECVLEERIKSVENTISSMSEDTKKNAQTYWRMMIDDWMPNLTLFDFTNLLLSDDLSWASSLIKNEDGGHDFVIDLSSGVDYLNVGSTYYYRKSQTKSIFENGEASSFGIAGKTIEIGFTDVLFEDLDGVTYYNDTPYTEGTTNAGGGQYNYPNGLSMWFWYHDGSNSSNNKTYLMPTNSIQSELNPYIYGKAIRVAFGENDGILFSYQLNSSTKPTKGKIIIKNFYMIDISEHDDEITKNWYTNIYPSALNYSSAMPITYKSSKYYGKPVYDITADNSGSPWGWALYRLTSDEVKNLRGHTVEFGCISMSFSNVKDGFTGRASNLYDGGANWKFGVGINDKENPGTYILYSDLKNKSVVWDGLEIPCYKFTIPSDASSITIGNRSYGLPTGVIMSAVGVYMYDLGEDVSIRGKKTTLSSMRIARVSESVESESPTHLSNTMYITDKGRLYCYDLGGKKYDIPGSIYASAVLAGYEKSADEFGSDLYSMLKQKGNSTTYTMATNAQIDALF